MHPSDIFAAAADTARFVRVLNLLSKYVRSPILITGGYAVQWDLLRCGGDASPIKLNDIDIVVENDAAIAPAISDGFLIHHFHPTREKGNVLLQLVEPVTRTRVDIFSARSAAVVERATPAKIGAADVLVTSAEDLFARLAAIVAIVIDGRTVDGKYLESLRRLIAITDGTAAAALWPEYRAGKESVELRATIDAIEKAIEIRPDLLSPTEYARDPNAPCEWCVNDQTFKLAEPALVFELLGHV